MEPDEAGVPWSLGDRFCCPDSSVAVYLQRIKFDGLNLGAMRGE